MGTDLNELGKIRLIYPWTQDVNCTYRRRSHCVKGVRIRSYSGQYFLALRLNKDQNNSECEHFLRSVRKRQRRQFLQIRPKFLPIALSMALIA